MHWANDLNTFFNEIIYKPFTWLFLAVLPICILKLFVLKIYGLLWCTWVLEFSVCYLLLKGSFVLVSNVTMCTSREDFFLIWELHDFLSLFLKLSHIPWVQKFSVWDEVGDPIWLYVAHCLWRHVWWFYKFYLILHCVCIHACVFLFYCKWKNYGLAIFLPLSYHLKFWMICWAT